MSETQRPDNKEQAARHYAEGRRLWALGRRGEAISQYNLSLALDPDGPARTALEMINSIMDFYDKNQLNP